MSREFDNFEDFNDGTEVAMAQDFGRHHFTPIHRRFNKHCRPVCHCGRFGCRCDNRCGRRFW